MNDTEQAVAPAFSDYSAHDTALAARESQQWIEVSGGRGLTPHEEFDVVDIALVRL